MRKQSTTKTLLEFDPKPKNILPAIKKICKISGYLGKKDAERLAEYFSIPLSRVYETASFYDGTGTWKLPEVLIQVCDSANCMISGSFDIVREIENILGIREGDKNSQRVRLEAVSCMGRCGEGPVVVVNGKVHERVDKGKVHEILKEWY